MAGVRGEAKAAPRRAAEIPAAAEKAPVKKAAAKKSPVKKAPVKKAPAQKAVKKAAAEPAVPHSGGEAASEASDLDVAGLTAADLAEIRARLQDELTELRLEYDRSLIQLNELRQHQADGSGDDQADAGNKTFEREQEESIAANRRLLLTQIEHAIERIDSGVYGLCEDCGRPIPKARLKALPMATLDAQCKARAERR
ncbi:MAG TPA: TraR/DksA C4-type zinc finger protein [Jatrophihabitans sp.]|jgi:RNA polymerase-binding protein DksA|uniref:TraR/DksA family transcriptional regulator n=1 Tax=Jatrophihabitans sp. TaxID=1932789 RepID=UPI002EF53A11